MRSRADISNISAKQVTKEEKYYIASQWQLMWRKFKKHRLALAGGSVLALFYVLALFCEFFSPNIPHKRHTQNVFTPPQRVRIFYEGKLHRPFVYGLHREIDLFTREAIYTVDTSKIYPIRLFGHGEEYVLWGLLKSDIHLITAAAEAPFFIFGTDKFGRDLCTRILYASRISLSVGLVGVAVSFILGVLLLARPEPRSSYFSSTILSHAAVTRPNISASNALCTTMYPFWSKNSRCSCSSLVNFI